MESKGHVVSEEELYAHIRKKISLEMDGKHLSYCYYEEYPTKEKIFIFFEILSNQEEYKHVEMLCMQVYLTYETFCYFCELFNYHNTINKIKSVYFFGGIEVDSLINIYSCPFTCRNSLGEKSSGLSVYTHITTKTLLNIHKFINDEKIIDRKEILTKWIACYIKYSHLTDKHKEELQDFYCISEDLLNIKEEIIIPNDMTKWYYSTLKEKKELSKETYYEFKNFKETCFLYT